MSSLPDEPQDLEPVATGGRIYRLLGWLILWKDRLLWCAFKIPAFVLWVVDQFTNRKIALIKAEAEAEKTRAEAEKLKAEAEAIREKAKAEAEKTMAEAIVTQARGIAEAHGIEAEAQSKQAEADRKKHELQALKKNKGRL